METGLDRLIARADLAERNLMLCVAQRDAAQTEAADLRRQLATKDEALDRMTRGYAHMTQWRDSAIVDGNAARAEAADLRRETTAIKETLRRVLFTGYRTNAERDADEETINAWLAQP